MKKPKAPLDHPLVQELVDKRVCVSRAEARRMVVALPEEKIREKYLNRKIVIKKRQAL